jgi:acyl carrier protein
MHEAEIKEKVRDYLKSNFFIYQDATIEDNTSFLEARIVDSTGLMEIVFFIQTEFNITIEDKDLLPNNLDSINNITRFLIRNGV